MGIDLVKLASQGRAYSSARPWTETELASLITLEKERGLGRLAAADFVRNGIVSVEDYDAAIAADFKPKTLDEAHAEAEDALKGAGAAAVKPKKGAKKN